MTRDEIMVFINANPTCYLATVDGDAPHVRAMGMNRADERGILFQLSTLKGMCRELLKNGKIELSYTGSGKMIRTSGTADCVEGQSFKEEVLGALPFLKPLVDDHGWEALKVFRVASPVAMVRTMATNLESREFVKL